MSDSELVTTVRRAAKFKSAWDAARQRGTALGEAWTKARIASADGGRLAIIDTDIFCYQAITEAMVQREVEDGQWTWHVDAREVAATVAARIVETADFLRAEQIVLCFGSKSNWRKKVMGEYKKNRSKKKPLGWWAVVDALAAQFQVVSRPFLEADDVAGLLHTAPPALFEHVLGFPHLETVVVSEDKDYRTLPGLLHNPRAEKQQIEEISLDQADREHMMQTLTGDATDGYKGCPGVGKVGAAKILDEIGRDGWWDAVVATYREKGLDEKEALVNARVARILRYPEYDWDTGEMELWTPRLLEVA